MGHTNSCPAKLTPARNSQIVTYCWFFTGVQGSLMFMLYISAKVTLALKVIGALKTSEGWCIIIITVLILNVFCIYLRSVISQQVHRSEQRCGLTQSLIWIYKFYFMPQFTSPFNYYMFSIKVHCLLLILAMVPWKGACWSSFSLVVISHINPFVFHRVSYQVQRCSWSNLAHVPFV